MVDDCRMQKFLIDSWWGQQLLRRCLAAHKGVVVMCDNSVLDAVSFRYFRSAFMNILELVLKVTHHNKIYIHAESIFGNIYAQLCLHIGLSLQQSVRISIIAVLFTMDNNSKYQTLLISVKTTPKLIDQFCKNFDRSKVPLLLDVLVCIEQSLSCKSQPHVKLNSVLMLLGFVRLADYPTVVFTEALLLSLVAEGAKTAASNDNKKIYDYFEHAGYSSSTPNLQSLSYHYTRHCLLLVLLLAYLHPKRTYKNKEFNVPSPPKQLEQQLFEAGLKDQEYNQMSATNGFLTIRKEFLKGLVGLQRHSDSYVQPVIKIMEKYLVTGNKTKLVESILGLLRFHDAHLCTEVVPRLAEIFCYHNDFRVKRDALLLINDVLFSGDLEALVILNFTQYFKIVALKIADATLHAKFNKLVIFPEVAGQLEEKRLFLNEFLLTVERIARLFPTLQAYFLNSGESPIYQIYRKLGECGARFPKWEGEEQFMARVGANFRANRQYNLLFLEELERQRVQWLVMDPHHPTCRNLLYFIDRNTHNLTAIRQAHSLNPNDNEWLELLEFRKHFEEMLERLTDDIPAEDMEDLIWRGLSLKSSITALQQLHARYQRGQIAKQQFQAGLNSVPSQSDPGMRRRMEELGQGLRKREKESIQVSLNEKESVIKSKVNLRIQELASKKADSCEVISQLDIYSRSFIAHKLHSQEIMDQFLPLLYFHPLRKQKRRNNGIRICSEERTPSPEHPKGDSTPKFRSVIAEEKSGVRKGLKVMQREGAKYEKYLEVLSRRDWVKHLTSDALIILDRGWTKIQRSEIRSSNLPENQILEVIFTCFCTQGTDGLKYSVVEEPSVQLKTRKKQLNVNTFQLEVKGLWIKFGYSLPTITFTIKNEEVTVPLPFSFNNYLVITPTLKDHKRPPIATQRHKLDKKEFPYIQSIKKYLKGMRIQGNKLSGCTKFFSWECNLRIILQLESFVVELEPTVEKEDDILLNFLPLFLVRLFAAPQ